MSRDGGFTRADIDTGLFADTKVVALARRLRDPVQTAAHVALYTAVVLVSWGADERIPLEDAVPAWWLDPIDEVRANLQAVRLLDSDGRIPEHAWASWYAPATERRANTRERWRRANLKRQRGDHAVTAASHRGDSCEPGPSGPSGPIRPLRPVRPVVARGARRDLSDEALRDMEAAVDAV